MFPMPHKAGYKRIDSILPGKDYETIQKFSILSNLNCCNLITNRRIMVAAILNGKRGVSYILVLFLFAYGLAFGDNGQHKYESNRGIIEIQSRPSGARIFVGNDDNFIGTTPAITSLAAGPYRLSLRKESYLDFDTTIVIAAGSKNNISPRLVKNIGGVKVITYPPKADIFINGAFVGRSPRQVDDVPGDFCEIVVSRDGYKEFRIEKKVSYGEVTEVEIILEEQASGIMVYSEPEDAILIIDGEIVEYSGVLEYAPGSYILELSREGYYPQKKSVKVEKRKISGARFSLRKIINQKFYRYGVIFGGNTSYNGEYELPAPSFAVNKENTDFGFFLGAYINIPISNTYFLRSEISYLEWDINYGKERESYVQYELLGDSDVVVDAWYHVDLDYVNLSFLFTQAGLDSRGYFNFMLGPSLSILARKQVIIEPRDFFEDVEDLQAKGVYLGFNAGISAGKRLFFEARFHLGFSNIRKYEDGKPLHLRAALGYRL
jgi:hypothetical protein